MGSHEKHLKRHACDITFFSLHVPSADFDADNVDKNFVGTFRRLSAAFEAMEAAEREANENSSDDEVELRNDDDEEDLDLIQLGEEGEFSD